MSETASRTDDRWLYGMNGWRVHVPAPGDPDGRYVYGEVTGFSHDGGYIWAVIDGEEDGRRFRWEDVRPA